MTRLKSLGFFRELDHGSPEGPSLAESLSKDAWEDDDKVIRYFESGVMFIGTFGPARDVLQKSKVLICAPHILTDGVWAWPNDLSYYVEKYHARLPQEFLDHAIANEWKVPEIEQTCLGDFELAR